MIGKRLIQLEKELKFKNRKEFADFLEISYTSLRHYELRGKVPSEVIEIIIKKTGVSVKWLVIGEGNMFDESLAVSDETVAKLPVLDVRASAGTGIENLSAEIVDEITIERRILLPFPAEKCKVIFASGDSMSPTIFDGELLIFVDKLIDGNGIYVIRNENQLMVKRVEFHIGAPEITIKSDNAKYGDYTLVLSETNVELLGRVILHLHRPR